MKYLDSAPIVLKLLIGLQSSWYEDQRRYSLKNFSIWPKGIMSF